MRKSSARSKRYSKKGTIDEDHHHAEAQSFLYNINTRPDDFVLVTELSTKSQLRINTQFPKLMTFSTSSRGESILVRLI
jgi:hypothetical protein